LAAGLLRLGRFFRVPEERLEIKNKFGQNAAKAVFWSLCSATAILQPNGWDSRNALWKILFVQLGRSNRLGFRNGNIGFLRGTVVSLEQLIAWVAQFTLVALLLVLAWIVVPCG